MPPDSTSMMAMRLWPIGGRSSEERRMVSAPCPIPTNWSQPGQHLTLTRQAYTALPSLAKGQHVTPVRDAVGVGEWIRIDGRMTSKFTLRPWRRIKDELLDIQPAVPFAGGKEAEHALPLPFSRKGGAGLCA